MKRNSEMYLMHSGRKGMRWGEHVFDKNKKPSHSIQSIPIRLKLNSVLVDRVPSNTTNSGNQKHISEAQLRAERDLVEREYKDLNSIDSSNPWKRKDLAEHLSLIERGNDETDIDIINDRSKSLNVSEGIGVKASPDYDPAKKRLNNSRAKMRQRIISILSKRNR